MRKIGFVVVLMAMAAASPAHAFDCAKAKSQEERTICANPELKQADDAMSAAYGALKARLDAEAGKALLASQRVWLASRKDCAEYAECLLARTQERTRVLAMQAPGPADNMEVVPYFRAQAGSSTRWSIQYAAFRLTPDAGRAFGYYLKANEAELPFVDLDAEEALPDGRFYIHDETVEPTFLSARFLSVLDSIYVDGGGAHGNYGRIGAHFDLVKDAKATFADVFTPDAAAALAPECVGLIAAEKKVRLGEEAEVDAAAVASSVADLSRWSFTPTGGKVMFDPYEVGSFAEGEYECAFVAQRLKPLLKADGPLSF